MGGGFFAGTTGAHTAQYPARFTASLVTSATVGATSGFLFGYDLGITGGVVSMDNFLQKFFVGIFHRQQQDATNRALGLEANNPYCAFSDQKLQAFTSSFFLSGLVFALVAWPICSRYGRKTAMIIAGAAYIIGAILLAFAQDLPMLCIGRVILGVGVGFANASGPLYLSEMPPPKWRGFINIMFQWATTIGILVAGLVNYGTQHMDTPGHLAGWRISVGMAGVPGILLLLGSLCVPDTPNSLMYRGKEVQARKVLERVRGTDDVDQEFSDIKSAVDSAKTRNVKSFALLTERRYRGVLCATLLMPFFQQFSGINTIMFYAAELFKVLGKGSNASLLNVVIIGAVNVAATWVSIILVDRIGRRALLLQGSSQMIISFIAVAITMAVSFNMETGQIPKAAATIIIVFECLFTGAFAWSWGPLGWLVPSEVHNVETRALGMAIATSVNFLMSFVIGQWYLSMLCGMRWGTYIFFAFWVLVMGAYAAFFLPETKKVAIEDMAYIWAEHWFWKRIVMTRQELTAYENGDMVGAGLPARTKRAGGDEKASNNSEIKPHAHDDGSTAPPPSKPV